MKLALIIGLFCFTLTCFGQDTKPLTMKYSGVYNYGKNTEKGNGTIFICPEIDSNT